MSKTAATKMDSRINCTSISLGGGLCNYVVIMFGVYVEAAR